MDRLRKIAEMILKEAKARGADYAHCVVRESEKREFNVDGDRFSLMRTLFDRDVSITVLKEQRKGSVHINRFDEEAVRNAVAECIAASESAEPEPGSFAVNQLKKAILREHRNATRNCCFPALRNCWKMSKNATRRSS